MDAADIVLTTFYRGVEDGGGYVVDIGASNQ